MLQHICSISPTSALARISLTNLDEFDERSRLLSSSDRPRPIPVTLTSSVSLRVGGHERSTYFLCSNFCLHENNGIRKPTLISVDERATLSGWLRFHEFDKLIRLIGGRVVWLASGGMLPVRSLPGQLVCGRPT